MDAVFDDFVPSEDEAVVKLGSPSSGSAASSAAPRTAGTTRSMTRRKGSMGDNVDTGSRRVDKGKGRASGETPNRNGC